MQTKTALVLGASGLIGSQLLTYLLNDDYFSKVRILVRKSLSIHHPKLEELVIDFNHLEAFQKAMGEGDVIFCCIGTTMKKVKGDKALYKSIDFDIAVNAARFGIEAGYRQYALVSAQMANANSLLFYNRIKGETEEVISTFPYESTHIFRPSFLIGNRKEQRIAEQFFGSLLQSISFLLPKPARPIEAITVALSMIRTVKNNKPGIHFYTYKEMKDQHQNSMH
ncbi:MAG: NAD(P)H-binding protein [Bacteroidetes bacterium]|nr:NAD(P)H-binding protein [Bacteroidota bacterium]